MMNRNKTKEWCFLLDDVLLQYNSDKHSTTSQIPEKVHFTENEKLTKKVNKREEAKAVKMKERYDDQVKHLPKLKKGHYVRISSFTTSDRRKNKFDQSKRYLLS